MRWVTSITSDEPRISNVFRFCDWAAFGARLTATLNKREIGRLDEVVMCALCYVMFRFSTTTPAPAGGAPVSLAINCTVAPVKFSTGYVYVSTRRKMISI